MFEVLECFDQALCKQYSNQFGADYQLGDRAFVFYEDGARGIGVMGLSGGAIRLKKVTDCGSEAYAEALLRTMLFSLSSLNPIQIIKKDVDVGLLKYGFTEKNGSMTILSNQINLNCH